MRKSSWDKGKNRCIFLKNVVGGDNESRGTIF